MGRSAGALLLRAAAVLVCAASVAYGTKAMVSDLETAFQFAPPSVFSSPFQAQMQIVARALPPGAALLYVSPFDEFWYSRMWQRALYPHNTVLLLEPGELDCTSISRYRRLNDARFAISVGDPSPGTGYLWSVSMGSLPGFQEETWFGELKP